MTNKTGSLCKQQYIFSNKTILILNIYVYYTFILIVKHFSCDLCSFTIYYYNVNIFNPAKRMNPIVSLWFLFFFKLWVQLKTLKSTILYWKQIKFKILGIRNYSFICLYLYGTWVPIYSQNHVCFMIKLLSVLEIVRTKQKCTLWFYYILFFVPVFYKCA